MWIEQQTVVFALALLNEHYSQIWTKRVGKQRETQSAYYNGMKLMLEIMLSNIYKFDIHIDVDGEGKHSIREDIFKGEEVQSVRN